MGKQISAISLGPLAYAGMGFTIDGLAHHTQFYQDRAETSEDASEGSSLPSGNAITTLLAACYSNGHPHWTRDKWKATTGQHHPSYYWPWLEKMMGHYGIKGMRYSDRDIFVDLLNMKKFMVNGNPAVLLHFQKNLIGQEVVNDAPKGAVCDRRLFELRPDLLHACHAMNSDFALDTWTGRSVEHLAVEYGKHHNPEVTPVLIFVGRRGKPTTLTLSQLWEAEHLEATTWRVGTIVLTLAA